MGFVLFCTLHSILSYFLIIWCLNFVFLGLLLGCFVYVGRYLNFEKAKYNLNVYNKTLLNAWHVFPKNQKDKKLIKEVQSTSEEAPCCKWNSPHFSFTNYSYLLLWEKHHPTWRKRQAKYNRIVEEKLYFWSI